MKISKLETNIPQIIINDANFEVSGGLIEEIPYAELNYLSLIHIDKLEEIKWD